MNKDKIINSFVAISHIKDYPELELSYKKKISFKDLYEISKEPEKFKNTKHYNLIFKNKNLTKVFYSYFKNNSQFFIPQARAASTEINRRVFDGGNINIIHSNKKDNIVYINLILDKKIEKKLNKIYLGKGGILKSLDLSDFIDNRCQIMIKQTDDVYNMLVDPNVEIFIR